VSVDHGGADVAVTQQSLDRPHVVVGAQEVTGETVTESMASDAFGYLSETHTRES
jgi:hypothetical protein